MSVRIPPPDLLSAWQPGIFLLVLGAALVHRSAPFEVTSWYRDREHNSAVGGRSASQHLIGCALDVVPRPGVTVEEVAEGFRALGFTVVVEPDHVHVQVWPASPIAGIAV